MDNAQIVTYLLAAGAGYLLGSIPFGVILTRAVGINIREIGSGNIGATNVLRTGNKALAGATLIADVAKAALPVAALKWGFHAEEAAFIAGGAAFIGHCFPVWLKFKGGKGVATFFGITLAGLPIVGLFCALAWLVTAFVFRFSSLAALTAAALAPVFAYVFHGGPWAIGLCVLLAGLIFWRHRSNIGALLKGEERKIGAKEDARPA